MIPTILLITKGMMCRLTRTMASIPTQRCLIDWKHHMNKYIWSLVIKNNPKSSRLVIWNRSTKISNNCHTRRKYCRKKVHTNHHMPLRKKSWRRRRLRSLRLIACLKSKMAACSISNHSTVIMISKWTTKSHTTISPNNNNTMDKTLIMIRIWMVVLLQRTYPVEI